MEDKSQLDESIDYEEEGSMTFETNVNVVDAIWQKTIVWPLIYDKGLSKEHCSPWVGNWNDISSYIVTE